MISRRVVIRTVLGAAVIAVCAGATAAAVVAPLPEVSAAAPTVVVDPQHGPVVLACTGDVLALGRTVESADAIAIAAATQLVSGTSAGAAPTNASVNSQDVDGATVPLVVQSGGQGAGEIAGAASAELSDDDVSGFTASACRVPQLENWIVGGDTATGISGVLLITNPGDVSADLTLTVYGTAGPQEQPGTLVIPPRSQRALSLAGIAGGESSPIVHVLSEGTGVQVSLQSSVQRTLVAAGLDVQGPAAPPATTQVIPGVSVAGVPEGVTASNTTLVRILAPREDGTVVVTPLLGGARQQPITLELAAGVPGAVDLSALPEGSYDVLVEADVAVVSATQSLTGFAAGDDLAWYVAAPQLDSAATFAVATGPSPVLHLVNTGDEVVSALVGRVGSSAQTVDVPAGEAAQVTLQPGTVWTVDPQGGRIAASVAYSGDRAIAGYPVLPAAAQAERITIHP